jgi:hypothetical protein
MRTLPVILLLFVVFSNSITFANSGVCRLLLSAKKYEGDNGWTFVDILMQSAPLNDGSRQEIIIANRPGRSPTYSVDFIFTTNQIVSELAHAGRKTPYKVIPAEIDLSKSIHNLVTDDLQFKIRILQHGDIMLETVLRKSGMKFPTAHLFHRTSLDTF